MNVATEAPTITRAQARNALQVLNDLLGSVTPAVDAAPHSLGRAAASALHDLQDIVAGELGLEVIGSCECGVIVFDGDDYLHTRDGCSLCADCRPTDADLARIAAIQAACPNGDEDCEAQSEDDHARCSPQTDRTEST